MENLIIEIGGQEVSAMMVLKRLQEKAMEQGKSICGFLATTTDDSDRVDVVNFLSGDTLFFRNALSAMLEYSQAKGIIDAGDVLGIAVEMAGVFDDEKTPTEAATSGEGQKNIN